jgi:hypothetical protein
MGGIAVLLVGLGIGAPAQAQVEADSAVATTGAAEQSSEYRVDVGGYGSFRLEGSNRNAGGEPAFTLRRFVVTTDARVGSRLQVYSEVEYERLGEIEVERGVERDGGGLKFEQELEGTNGSELALEQAWAQLNLTPGLGVRFGAVLPPVGRFNLHHDDNLWNFPRRPLIDRSAQVLPGKAAWTEMGLGVVGQKEFTSGARLGYQAYLLTGTTLDFTLEQVAQTRAPKRSKLEVEAEVSPTQGAFDGSNAADAVAGRLELSPTLGSEFAISGYLGRYTPEWLDVNESLATVGLDGTQKLGSFYLEGEFLYSRYAGVDRVAESFARAAVEHAVETSSAEAATLESEIEVELKNLAETRYGFWVDLGRPISLKRGTLGFEEPVLTPTVRYEQAWVGNGIAELDFSGGAVTGLERADQRQSRLSIGLAFRPITQAVVQLAYERSAPVEGDLFSPEVGAEDAGRTIHGLTLGLAVGF